MKRVRNALVLAGTVAVIWLVPIAPAYANVSISTSLTVPQGVSVGDTGVAGSLVVTNQNTPPHEATQDTITSIQLALGCAALPAPPNLCPSPDTGISSVASPALGEVGTACAGVTFTVSAPDAAGIVTFTSSPNVVLNPPGSAAGTEKCKVSFTFSVLKVPTVDTNVNPGVQTRVNLRVVATAATLTLSNNPTVEITVNRAIPGLSTQASPRVQVGGSISDTATLTGVPNIATPTGTVTFNLYPPSDPTCAGAPVQSQVVALSTGSATSPAFTTAATGFYRYVATYSGDANYIARSGTCGDPGEVVEATANPPVRAVADFDGNGTTDIAVYRPSTQQWFIRNGPTVQYGAANDIPVPADYDGDGDTDLAVYRPSTQQWFVRGGSPEVVQFGAANDIPVPADYDGNGSDDIAVFRPSTQQWFDRNNGQTVQFGAAGDIPVPADYDGDGTDDIAVFRPSTQQWFVRSTGQTVQFGALGDIPIPGDYTGDGMADIAVFRPSTQQFFVRTNGLVAQWGAPNDVPVPGDYDGNGSTDVAVFRPSTAQFFVLNGQIRQWGTSSDIPLQLPNHIRRFFF